MSAFLEWILIACLAVVGIPVLLLLVEVLLALPGRRSAARLGSARPSMSVLIPAHNEGQGIQPTLAMLLPQLGAGDRVLVVADNCSDDTAQVARAAGVEVVERVDTEHRGKGYALDYGVRHLANKPSQVVVVVDADCFFEAGAIERIGTQAHSLQRPVQAFYTMKAPEGAGLKTQIAAFAWQVKNWVRPLGYHRVGLPCQLMGTGMAFPWPVISEMNLASGHIVEDMKLGMDLAERRCAPVFCPQAQVTSYFPLNSEGTKSQRTRWEHGHIAMILSDAPKLLGRAIVTANLGLLSLTLDLCIPPLALLTMMVIGLAVLAAVLWATTGKMLPLAAAAIVLAMLVSAIMLAWARFGRTIISFAELLMVGVYMVWKIPLYLKFFGARQVEWIRSKRDEVE